MKQLNKIYKILSVLFKRYYLPKKSKTFNLRQKFIDAA